MVSHASCVKLMNPPVCMCLPESTTKKARHTAFLHYDVLLHAIPVESVYRRPHVTCATYLRGLTDSLTECWLASQVR
jgi:hypothetical protein